MPSVTVEMLQADVKCFNLPDSRTDNPPAGWDQVGFDDSAWGLSANPALPASTAPPGAGGQTSAVWSGPNPSTLPGAGQACWATATKQGDYQGCAFRWRITVPSLTPTAQTRWHAGPTPICALSQSVVINGTSAFSNLPTSTFPPTSLVVGENLIAIKVVSLAGGFATWPTLATGSMDVNGAWMAYEWVFNVLSASGGRSFAQVIG